MTAVLVSRPLWLEHQAEVEAMLARAGYAAIMVDVPGSKEEVVLYCTTRSARCAACDSEVQFTGRAGAGQIGGPPMDRIIRYPLHCPNCNADPTGRR
jgi:hypothetical protein